MAMALLRCRSSPSPAGLRLSLALGRHFLCGDARANRTRLASRNRPLIGLKEACWQEQTPLCMCLARKRMSFRGCSSSATLEAENSQVVDFEGDWDLQKADFATYAALLRRCGNAKDLLEGKLLHAHIMENGYDDDRFLGNFLVQMYGKCGSLEDARTVFYKICQPNRFSWNIMLGAYAQNGHVQDARSMFDEMPLRDLVSWNVMMAAYVQNGHGKVALELFRRMDSEGLKPDKITFINSLDACASLNSLKDGKVIHASIVDSDLESDFVVGTALVDMYGKCGSLEDARMVFHKMLRRDAVSWTAMIAAYAQNGHGKGALELFHQMDLEGVKPDKITFMGILEACGSLAAIEEGKVIHARLLDQPSELDLTLGNALVNMYGKCGGLEEARSVFDKMTQRDVVSWNSLISAYVLNGDGEGALQLFRQISLEEGVKPDKVTFISVFDACASLASLEEGKLIHASIADTELGSDLIVGNATVNMYGKCGSSQDARNVFDRMPQRDVVSWNTMIAAYAENGDSNMAIELFQQMNMEAVVKPDRVTFISILDACASVAVLKEGKEIHAFIVEAGLESDIVLGTSLVKMYGKCGSLQDARNVFDRMPQLDVVSWSTMIGVYVQNRHGKASLQLFRQMVMEGLSPDKITFVGILNACTNLASLEEGKAIHMSIVNTGCVLDSVLGTALVNMYSKCGSLEDARAVFDKISQQDVVSWTALISAYAQSGHCKAALELLGQMDLEGVKPDNITFISIVDACAHLAILEQGKVIHARIAGEGFESDDAVKTALIHMYGKCGSLEDARRAFSRIWQPDVISWNAMIAAYSQNGHGKEAIALFQQMGSEGVKPDAITFISVLSACSRAGLLDDGRRYFISMSRDHGVIPTVGHYVCMIDLLGRAGQLNEAEHLIYNMPVEPHVVVWTNFLSACRSHVDVERGIHVAEHIFELDPTNAAPYVLLSNIYATADRWDDVGHVRKEMKHKGVQKQPGHSRIEVKNRVHEFVVRDTSHPQREMIYAELHRLTRQIEELGYVADTKAVLHDLVEEKKKHMLYYHSEKVAIAYGLITTPPGTPLRIIKNLRVCSDCHAFTKFITKVVGRKIIVRDANRFHHFQDGSCSCGDYW